MPPATQLNPFALPSETGQRFRLLLLIATLAAYNMGTLWIYRFGPDGASLSDFAGVGLIAVALLWVGAFVLYIVHQLQIPGLRGGLLPPAADGLLTARIAALGIGPSPRVVVTRDIRSSAALAYGLPWSPRILLGGALRLLLRRDPGGFDAIVRHELAHHQNKDVGKVFIARACSGPRHSGQSITPARGSSLFLNWDPADPVMVQIGRLLPELPRPPAFLPEA
jgi:Zn-dependent protease with chaperone function